MGKTSAHRNSFTLLQEADRRSSSLHQERQKYFHTIQTKNSLLVEIGR